MVTPIATIISAPASLIRERPTSMNRSRIASRCFVLSARGTLMARMATTSSRTPHQVPCQCDPHIEGAEGDDRVKAFGLRSLRNLTYQRRNRQRVHLRVGSAEKSRRDRRETDLCPLRCAPENSLPPPFTFLRRIFSHH